MRSGWFNYFEPTYNFELYYWTRKHLVKVFYRCSVWFDSSEPHRTTPLDTREFGVVQSLFRISSNLIEPHQTLARYSLFMLYNSLKRFGRVVQANTWLGCCTGVQCGSISKSQHKQTLGEGVLHVFSVVPNFFELHYWTGKHLVRVLYRCLVWFDH